MSVNADGSEPNQLSAGEGSYWEAVWSPEGNRIAVTKSDPTGAHVYIMDDTGSGLRQLVEMDSAHPSWSPDGRFLAFAGNPRGGEADGIYRVDVRTGNINLLVAAPETLNQSPVWSPDGTRIAFIRLRLGGEGSQTTTLGSELFIMDADGTNLQQLSRGHVFYSSPTWSRTVGPFFSCRGGRSRRRPRTSYSSSTQRREKAARWPLQGYTASTPIGDSGCFCVCEPD